MHSDGATFEDVQKLQLVENMAARLQASTMEYIVLEITKYYTTGGRGAV